jgi:surfeit locus 1 family protein
MSIDPSLFSPRAATPPRWRSALLAIGTVAFVVLTVALGQWQTRRAVEKADRLSLALERGEATPIELAAAPLDIAGLEWRRVLLRGHWRVGSDGQPGGALLIDNRLRNHRPGYEVVQLFEIEGDGSLVLVNRGWTPARADRGPVSVVVPPAGPVVLEGTLLLPDEHRFSVGSPVYPVPAGPLTVWPSLSVVQFQQVAGLKVAPWVLQQTSVAGDSLDRAWPGPPDDADRHRAYALQWYSFAAIAAGIYLTLGLRRYRRLRQSAQERSRS